MAPKIIAHRGFSSQAPENTLSAFQKAIEQKVGFIECDVRITQDKIPIIFHDQTPWRTTNKKSLLKISRFTLEEVKQFDAGSWFSEKYTGEQVPTLEELLQMDRQETGLMIELKVNHREKGFTEIIAQTLQKHKDCLQRVIIGCLSPFIIEELKALIPHIPTIGIAYTEEKLRQHLCLKPDFIAVDHCIITESLLRNSHDKNLSVWAWLVNDSETALKLSKEGIDGIITDTPSILKLFTP